MPFLVLLTQPPSITLRDSNSMEQRKRPQIKSGATVLLVAVLIVRAVSRLDLPGPFADTTYTTLLYSNIANSPSTSVILPRHTLHLSLSPTPFTSTLHPSLPPFTSTLHFLPSPPRSTSSFHHPRTSTSPDRGPIIRPSPVQTFSLDSSSPPHFMK
jgi:hypothetical protein